MDDYENQRQLKQQYLIDKIVDQGYDANQFASFLNQQKHDGVNIDNWDYKDL